MTYTIYSKIHWRPFNLSPYATLVYELANAKKRPLNLSACATLAHKLANAKKCPLNLSIRATLIYEHANTKLTPAEWHCSAMWPPLVGHAWHRLWWWCQHFFLNLRNLRNWYIFIWYISINSMEGEICPYQLEEDEQQRWIGHSRWRSSKT